jgi:hypothetical protein
VYFPSDVYPVSFGDLLVLWANMRVIASLIALLRQAKLLGSQWSKSPQVLEEAQLLRFGVNLNLCMWLLRR